MKVILAGLFVSLLAAWSDVTVGRESPIEASGIRSDFVCTQDTGLSVVPQNSDAQGLFLYARHLEYLHEGDFNSGSVDEFNRISRYYRIASAYGNADATEALRALQWRLIDDSYDGVVTQLRRNREREAERLTTLLTQQYPSRGYLLQASIYAQAWNLTGAFILYRKAADLGNAQAQYRLAQYLDVNSIAMAKAFGAKAKDIAFALPLYRCAAQQGHGGAMYELAIKQAKDRRYPEAMAGFQQAAMMGEAAAAFRLREAFGEQANGPLSLGRESDAARYERYEKIRIFLIDEQNFAPRVPDLNQIVPLPPAALPEWDGTFLWKPEQHAPRETPSETLMAHMAKAKGLDPLTGLPKDAAP
ncbi:DUF6396 domain-containing protein [Pseudomonas syringae]|uniref:DUF6396 domain-containing protein n=1 Tax=Pseudomonas syringae TaxID=317 RepID=UPI000BB5CAD4|nr:DUF6396 domain-containing protein [Pseudomonas syringae]MBI6721947.1 sel1 repeat family protein [Pseudomonas syringae]MBI6757494.1 sel1 repeat family protein [Pseudomonas syringae]MBI6768283.1 sel1 repeat family protein [Pseudomonas syringae]MBI6788879.1 sel1 repeat family protein [Pseudomonas syringae]PBP62671.1 hypothetical protein CCL15_27580 [Pseudomonas syringae]